jgi:anthranilate synthase component 2
MRLLVIDNYDSFTYNLVHFLGELGAVSEVKRNDKISLEEIADMAPEAIVLSPGPATPDTAGICLAAIERFAPTTPMLGVCLGHQAMGQAFGGDVIRAPNLMHGKTSKITHTGRGLFRGLNSGFEATRYHSLIVKPETLPTVLEVTAKTDDGLIMGMQHRDYPTHGVQFHPESIASENGHALLQNFLNIARDYNLKRAA